MIVLDGSIGNYIQLNKRRYSFFAGNNYLGLAGHTSIKKDAINAIRKYGINFSASRQTSGTSILHLELEKLLSEFKNNPESVIFASGYLGNRILLHSLKDQYSALFIDESSHPSITDGVPGGFTNLFFYKHCDPGHLELLLEKYKKFRPLIITDGIFALTGEIAPLDKIYPLAVKYDARIIIDDAHATGILGENGRGTPEHFHLDKTENIYQSETMSKAVGAYGGFISADREIINTIRSGSNIYLASTALPPPLAAAGCTAINILMKQPGLRSSVIENANKIRDGIKNLGFKTTPDKTPIIPVLFNFQENALNLSGFLEENSIIAPYINYPGKRDKFLLRITASALHTRGQIEELLAVFNKWRKNHEPDKD